MASSRRPRARKSAANSSPPPPPAQASVAPPPPPSPPPPAASDLTGPQRIDGSLYFSRADLHLYELKQLEVRYALQQIALKRLDIERQRQSFEEQLRAANHDLAQVTAAAKVKEESLRGLQRGIEHVYGVDLQRVMYDPDTGRITIS